MNVTKANIDISSRGNERIIFTLENDGKSIEITSTKDKNSGTWKVHSYINNERHVITKIGKLVDVIYNEIGDTFHCTRQEFIENLYQKHK